VILPGLLAIGLPTPHTTTVVRNENAIIPRDHVVPPQVEQGRGLVPAKINPVTGKPMLTASGSRCSTTTWPRPTCCCTFSHRHSGPGIDRAAGQLHERHGRQRHRLQHRLYLRSLPVLHHKGGSDRHYMAVGRWATVGGILLSIATAYAAISFNNIMDTLQLVFSFVNAPLFATFLLGMFWKRATGHGAFAGLIAGTAAAMLHHGLTLPIEAQPRHSRRMDRRAASLPQRHGAELLGRSSPSAPTLS
jgi:solute:Na+ symporter, SSS family